MTEKGRVIEVMPVQSGMNPRTGKKWMNQQFVIETDERFPIKIAFTIFGEDKVEMARVRVGELLTVVGYAESHKGENRWFTECRCTDIIDNGLSRFVVLVME